jgi:hypothetical protein
VEGLKWFWIKMIPFEKIEEGITWKRPMLFLLSYFMAPSSLPHP